MLSIMMSTNFQIVFTLAFAFVAALTFYFLSCPPASSKTVMAGFVAHDEVVLSISVTVKGFHDRKEKFRIFHGSTNSTRPSTHDPKKIVDVSRLKHVLHIDEAARKVIVEPNVPMDQLVAATLEYGLIPLVVPEFPGITVGGAFSGTAGESSSWKYGFFDRAVNWIEIVLGDGQVVKAYCPEAKNVGIKESNKRHDLFLAATGAFGTLGVTTLFELRLQPATKYVEVTYHPVRSAAEAETKMRECMANPTIEYIDGLLFDIHYGCIVTGRLTNTPKPKQSIVSFSRALDPWFYLHADDVTKSLLPKPLLPPPAVDKTPLASLKTKSECVPTASYFFRYDRGAFWMGMYTFGTRIPFNVFTRALLNPIMKTRALYAAMHAAGHNHLFMVQDLCLPVETSGKFLEFVHKEYDIYPLWLCPIKSDSKAPFHKCSEELQIGMTGTARGDEAKHTDFWMNIGVWGYLKSSGFDEYVAQNRSLEAKVKELQGRKWLYAQAFYSEEEFWKVYDRQGYEDVRRKYGAGNLMSVFEKMKGGETPVEKKGELRGYLRALRGAR